MRAPSMVLYLDEPGITGLLQQVEGGALIETTASVANEKGESIQAGAEAGGGFFAVLGLAKLSLGLGTNKKRAVADGRRLAVGPHAHLERLVTKLKANSEGRYFESLDDAFASAPEEGSSWVCVKDTFALTNIGGDLSFEALNREQRFLFEIDHSRSHTDRDDYFKRPPRRWHLSMAASFERCPRLKGRTFGVSSHEALYFRAHGYASIPLNVFGCYLKAQFRVQIIPYAIWI